MVLEKVSLNFSTVYFSFVAIFEGSSTRYKRKITQNKTKDFDAYHDIALILVG